VQVVRQGDPNGEAAAEALRASMRQRGREVKDFVFDPLADSADGFWRPVLEAADAAPLVLWLGEPELAALWDRLGDGANPQRIYVSGTLYGSGFQSVPGSLRDRLYLVYPYELPDKQNRLLARSTGWLRVKHIYAPQEKRVQANAFFALKTAGGALDRLHGYFLRDYLLERIEHMVDYASYSSVYPRISLAAGQRFVAKGCYIAKLSAGEGDGLVAVTDWFVP